jgi:hypothetical protein
MRRIQRPTKTLSPEDRVERTLVDVAVEFAWWRGGVLGYDEKDPGDLFDTEVYIKELIEELWEFLGLKIDTVLRERDELIDEAD